MFRTVGPVQRIITTEKSVVLDFDGASRDSKAFSKELYMWGQHEGSYLKDGMEIQRNAYQSITLILFEMLTI